MVFQLHKSSYKRCWKRWAIREYPSKDVVNTNEFLLLSSWGHHKKEAPAKQGV
jgi:hypothetical protein